jgi:hypothetical protein
MERDVPPDTIAWKALVNRHLAHLSTIEIQRALLMLLAVPTDVLRVMLMPLVQSVV